MSRIFGLILAFVLFFFAVLPHPSLAAKRGPIIFGLGAGYSFFLDSGLSSYEIYHPKLIYFSEQLNLKHNLNCHVQYFPWRGFGFQLEFDHQKAGYNSDLKWYGHLTERGDIIEINHIEKPYKETWSLSSFTASILYVLVLRQNVKMRPYISAGVGYYFSSGDNERFYYRTRLGPEKKGGLIKLGFGAKYQITPKVGINVRGVGGTIWRREYGFGNILYLGPEQFDMYAYAMTGKIVRLEKLFVNSFTFLRIALSLEYTL
jgi:hypothetical protein